MTQLISLITAIILLAVAIVGAKGNLPWWVVLLAVVVFLGWSAASGHRRVRAALTMLAQRRRDRRLVESHRGDLTRLTKELQTATESTRINVAITMQDIARRAVPDKQDNYNCMSLQWRTNSLSSALLSLLGSEVRARRAFTSSAKMLDALLWSWHDDVIVKPARSLRKDIETARYAPNAPEREAFSKTRKWHEGLVDDYVGFAKRVNDGFGEDILRVYWDPVPDIW